MRLLPCAPSPEHAHLHTPPRPLQYYPSVSSLLDRILDLLLGFIRRTHQALAAVGVAAMARLILAAGNSMDDETWGVVSA